MSENSSQEKTHEPTEKRKKDAKDKGQVLRSKELNTTAGLLLGGGFLLIYGESIISALKNLLTRSFHIKRHDLLDKNYMMEQFSSLFFDALIMLIPFFVVLIIATLLGGSALGGVGFNSKSLMPKFERISPIKGIKRIFSVKSLMELIKAIAKFTVVVCFALVIINIQLHTIFDLIRMPIALSMAKSAHILGWSFVAISSSMILLTLIDVPFQIAQNRKELRMTHQELKDELKNTDGNPEIKSKIKQLQNEVAQKRMMQEVPNADVIITNPTHYACALKYDKNRSMAPILVAKGCDLIAKNIRDIASENNVQIVRSPELARAIFRTTDLNREIPSGLYIAVAKVLAYVYQLKRHSSGSSLKPVELNDVQIPKEYKDKGKRL